MAAAHQSWNCVAKHVFRSQKRQTAGMQVRQNSGKIPCPSCNSNCAAEAQHPRHPPWVFGRAFLPSRPPSHPPHVTAVIGGASCWQQRSTSCQNRTGRGAGHRVAQRDTSSDENKARAEEVRGTTRPAVISNRVEWWSRGGAQGRRDGHRMDTARRTVTTTGELLGAKRRHEQTVDASASPRGRNHIQEAEASVAVHNTK